MPGPAGALGATLKFAIRSNLPVNTEIISPIDFSNDGFGKVTALARNAPVVVHVILSGIR